MPPVSGTKPASDRLAETRSRDGEAKPTCLVRHGRQKTLRDRMANVQNKPVSLEPILAIKASSVVYN